MSMRGTEQELLRLIGQIQDVVRPLGEVLADPPGTGLDVFCLISNSPSATSWSSGLNWPLQMPKHGKGCGQQAGPVNKGYGDPWCCCGFCNGFWTQHYPNAAKRPVKLESYTYLTRELTPSGKILPHLVLHVQEHRPWKWPGLLRNSDQPKMVACSGVRGSQPRPAKNHLLQACQGTKFHAAARSHPHKARNTPLWLLHAGPPSCAPSIWAWMDARCREERGLCAVFWKPHTMWASSWLFWSCRGQARYWVCLCGRWLKNPYLCHFWSPAKIGSLRTHRPHPSWKLGQSKGVGQSCPSCCPRCGSQPVENQRCTCKRLRSLWNFAGTCFWFARVPRGKLIHSFWGQPLSNLVSFFLGQFFHEIIYSFEQQFNSLVGARFSPLCRSHEEDHQT